MKKYQIRGYASRCNLPAVYYAPSNGFRLCDEHGERYTGEVNMLRCSEAGPGPHGRCDRPMTPGEIDDRHDSLSEWYKRKEA